MSTLEYEILEKFKQLDRDAKKRVRKLIEQESSSEEETETVAFDYDAWFNEVEAVRRELQIEHGGTLPSVDGIALLRDIRDGDDE